MNWHLPDSIVELQLNERRQNDKLYQTENLFVYILVEVSFYI